MNGELVNMSELVIAVKHYLKTSEYDRNLISPLNIASVTFRLAAFGTFEQQTATRVTEWMASMTARGLREIILWTGDAADLHANSAFSNLLDSVIVCFYDAHVTLWNKRWSFDREKYAWDIVYTERVYRQNALASPRFEDRTSIFAQVLTDIGQLATTLELDEFAETFRAAYLQLYNNKGKPNALPEKNRRLLEAAHTAFVFGGMKSWKEGPPSLAAERGVFTLYNDLTTQLHREIMFAVLYAVNEW